MHPGSSRGQSWSVDDSVDGSTYWCWMVDERHGGDRPRPRGLDIGPGWRGFLNFKLSVRGKFLKVEQFGETWGFYSHGGFLIELSISSIRPTFANCWPILAHNLQNHNGR